MTPRSSGRPSCATTGAALRSIAVSKVSAGHGESSSSRGQRSEASPRANSRSCASTGPAGVAAAAASATAAAARAAAQAPGGRSSATRAARLTLLPALRKSTFRSSGSSSQSCVQAPGVAPPASSSNSRSSASSSKNGQREVKSAGHGANEMSRQGSSRPAGQGSMRMTCSAAAGSAEARANCRKSCTAAAPTGQRSRSLGPIPFVNRCTARVRSRLRVSPRCCNCHSSLVRNSDHCASASQLSSAALPAWKSARSREGSATSWAAQPCSRANTRGVAGRRRLDRLLGRRMPWQGGALEGEGLSA
mmetsp:Transcript_59476/g.184615  ORF Transcript_59476/g.184615 Transcript_59476/m.184615 type:complete len:305 (-) Transcript_59476:12-926(-)